MLNTRCTRRSFSALVLTVAVTGLMACNAKSEAQSAPEALASNNAGMLIFGDSGYIVPQPGRSGIMPVAAAMKAYCESKACDFAAMTGDNIYPKGLTGNDAQEDARIIKAVFTDPYGDMTSLGDDFRIYMALGNHDWGNGRKGALDQVSFAEQTLPFYMDGLFYTVKPPAMNGDVEIFVIDTEMLLSTRTGLTYTLDKDSGEPVPLSEQPKPLASKKSKPRTPEEKAQLESFETALKTSDAKWKFVISHHPIWESNGGKYRQAVKLREFLRPIVCQYADVYMAGHQHTLEIQKDTCPETGRASNAPLLHLLSGAASKTRPLRPNFAAWQTVQNADVSFDYAAGDTWGFMHMQIAGDSLDIEVMGAQKKSTAEDFKSLYTMTLTK